MDHALGVERSRPHGHVVAVWGLSRSRGWPAWLTRNHAGSVQLSLFDTQNLAEVTDPTVARGAAGGVPQPAAGGEAGHKREDMLVATERELAKVEAVVERGAAGGRAG